MLPALAIVNCAAMNIGLHRFFWIGVSGFLGYNPSSGIARSKRSYILFSEEIPYIPLLHIRTLNIHWLLFGCFLHLAKKTISKLKSELKVFSQLAQNWNSIKHPPWFIQFRDLLFNHFTVTSYYHLLYWSMSNEETENSLVILTEIL